ncbi:MAG: hypothetical protein K6G26_09970, partial [Lachnospiraceae bacterium]|nr:hypothetical protein [Lachnospiraceae bacterium]
DGMCIRNFCMLDDIAYVINNDAIYKIDIKNNKKEKFADLEDKYNAGYGEIQMFSEKVGYCKGCYYTESEGYVDENELNVWFEQ